MLALAAALLATQPAQTWQVVDLVGEFDKVVDQTASLPPPQQADAVQQRFATLLPGFYDARRIEAPADKYRAHLAREIGTYRTSTRPGATRVRARFNAMIGPAVTDFERKVGALPPGQKIYLVVSLGEFDGATRTLPGSDKPLLMFGADMIAKYHGDGDARAFVQHELFHIYHAQRFPGCKDNWCSLWEEGLATHVAATLNPGASDADLLLTVPEPIRPAVEAHRTEAVCAVVERLDGDRDAKALFTFSRLSPHLPPRFGYLVGAWVAADLNRSINLQQLAEMKGPELRQRIEQSLRRMANCPAAAAS
ncbi:hypothetical protein OMW55_13055 [Sphingomonas sp. BN140010]|uniref:DUF2268 domain-containing protein n=1 Tax=Sphingomonas arvum TaxID=2992113 RepID=A0ABT3JI26_9SPHN|nr:hypothetical protein [Sphingomonas sp. BN140010]MCW3798737.1 hypothetical protein [Sphingomonas sp. BN140010]